MEAAEISAGVTAHRGCQQVDGRRSEWRPFALFTVSVRIEIFGKDVLHH